MKTLHGYLRDNAREEDLFQLRDDDDHEDQLWHIENAPNKYLRQYFCKEYGTNKRSALSDLPFFDVPRQLPQDIMHIFLEGILQLDKALTQSFNQKSEGYYSGTSI